MVGDEISQLIDEQKAEEQRYEQLIQQRGHLKGLANKAEYKNVQDNIAKVAKKLQEKTIALCRNLKDSPNIAENLGKIQMERNALLMLLKRTLSDLQDQHYQTLMTSVEEDRRRSEALRLTEQQEEKASQDYKRLLEELAQERVKHEEEKRVKQEEIVAKKKELNAKRQQFAFDLTYEKKKTEAELQCQKLRFELEEAGLREKLDTIEQRLAVEDRVHEENVGFLERKQKDTQELLVRWHQKLEKDQAEASLQVDRVANELVTLDSKRNGLQEKVTKEEKEKKDTEDAEAAAKQMREQKALEDAAKRAVSILRIQHWWHRKKNPPKKKKGKKGKKGKKKR